MYTGKTTTVAIPPSLIHTDTITQHPPLLGKVADAHHLDGDPDPACHFDANPDLGPACHLDMVPDPGPNFQIKDQNLEKVLK